MYAVVQTGGKQYKVAEGDKLFVEKLDQKVGAKVVLDQVLLIGGNGSLKVGSPFLNNAKIEAEVLEQDRAKKIIVLKKKRRKGYRKKQGHRQAFTVLKVKKIVV
ncbi:MAG: 50S ribosomal protein L21 [Deltaproteobacteria bacterium RIFCSPLOWO2_01_44_7]|nr:MAG: 50S ribosomal protein L21 [Deltaproteobacteria bacterium RIFCSPHIGHO2_01_FULL_43_49]OGQ14787.1 MAG: 50S ribosomal protein L21 [Deltaproteobacteria bacterium RIFCSPHIGHO2_02_FULL_44_53]OGQ28173.1 MAG: 50S ribosomal protein L21 [Deltaproteobacteria bacterium RIFCSPHIGHO2_12_FULL_44_21]OGQ31385.1 MAG: 50S ribosomal protein L21 [Deltaproteobacteria bacterium RIFCSPLOWO2_01_FULL_45_74]OGQ39059.1 MAG: 50S ribosomal protein L21 [Deltaproteobacteria bacterium RIFCSPLOWO2_01_44_7]OGQ43377.1 MAG